MCPPKKPTLRPGNANLIIPVKAMPNRLYLQSQSQADEVHHHLLGGQLYGEESQQGEERLEVALGAVLLIAHQVDVAEQPLGILTGHEKKREKVVVMSEGQQGCIFVVFHHLDLH